MPLTSERRRVVAWAIYIEGKGKSIGFDTHNNHSIKGIGITSGTEPRNVKIREVEREKEFSRYHSVDNEE